MSHSLLSNMVEGIQDARRAVRSVGGEAALVAMDERLFRHRLIDKAKAALGLESVTDEELPVE